MDTTFILQKNYKDPNESTLTCTKQKDHDEGQPLYFQRLIVRPNPGAEGSIVLVPAVRIDERFTAEFQEKQATIEAHIDALLADSTFKSDHERGRKLAELTGLTEGAAIKRVQRRRKS